MVASMTSSLMNSSRISFSFGFICAEPVGKTHRAPAGAAGPVPAHKAQTLKLKRRGGAVAASQVSRAAKFITVGELPAARNVGPGARADPERSGSVENAFAFAQEQVAGEYHDDRACDGKKSRARSTRPPGKSGERRETHDQHPAHRR